MSDFCFKHQKQITFVLLFLFLISIVPIVIVSGYDCASGDDYNYGSGAHLAFKATGSVFEAFKEAASMTVGTWKGWQGTWFDVFLFCLHPEVFSDSAYVIVPYIFMIMQIVCFSLFAHHFLCVRWKLGRYFWCEAALLFLIFSFQLVPSRKSAFFWWVGCIHYVMPMCLALIGIVFGDRFLQEHKCKDLIILCIVAACIGGATYPAALLLILSVFLLWLEGFVIGKKRDKRNIFLLIPFAFEAVGLIISVIAPGNANRSASDLLNGAVPTKGVIATIAKSVSASVTEAITLFVREKTFVLIAMLIVFVLSVGVLREQSKNRGKDFEKSFSHPVLFVVVMFLLNAAMYSPRIYAGGVVSSGYLNFNFWVFFICSLASIIYVTGFFVSRDISIHTNTLLVDVALIFLVCLIVFSGRHGVKEYTFYECMEYYLSGSAIDYKEQMALQRLLMEEEGVDDVVVPAINDYQGPLMHMPVVADPENIDNKMTCSFYGKNSCRSIDRMLWMEQYGEKYGY